MRSVTEGRRQGRLVARALRRNHATLARDYVSTVSHGGDVIIRDEEVRSLVLR